MAMESMSAQREEEKMMPSKGIVLLLAALMVLLAFPVQGGAETNEWYASEDGEIEVRLVSWEAGVYPQYEVQLQFRLDQSKESDIWIETIQIESDALTDSGRRVKATSSGNFCSFSRLKSTMYGTKYRVRLQYEIGEEVHEKNFSVDMAMVFPDDFINMNAYYAGQCLKKIEGHLGDYSSYMLYGVPMYVSKEYSDTLYFVFNMNVEYRGGGQKSENVCASYNTSTGSMNGFLSKSKDFFGSFASCQHMVKELETLETLGWEDVLPAKTVIFYSNNQ